MTYRWLPFPESGDNGGTRRYPRCDVAATRVLPMNDPGRRAGGRTWPYALGGALLLFAFVVLAYAGDYEGGDVVLVLGPLAAVVGGVVGALVGGVINGHRSQR
jgi:hypothetical protein